jgi:hypothetical protein
MNSTALPPAHDTRWVRPASCASRGLRHVGALVDRRLLGRAGPFDVDVLVRDMERPRGIEVVGQLRRADDLHVPAAGVPVTLGVPGGGAVDEVRTNAFGEFSFARRTADTLGLRLGDADGPWVLVWERRP